jgi:hypothetical protein
MKQADGERAKVKHHILKSVGDVEIILLVFPTFTLDEDE